MGGSFWLHYWRKGALVGNYLTGNHFSNKTKCSKHISRFGVPFSLRVLLGRSSENPCCNAHWSQNQNLVLKSVYSKTPCYIEQADIKPIGSVPRISSARSLQGQQFSQGCSEIRLGCLVPTFSCVGEPSPKEMVKGPNRWGAWWVSLVEFGPPPARSGAFPRVLATFPFLAWRREPARSEPFPFLSWGVKDGFWAALFLIRQKLRSFSVLKGNYPLNTRE